MLKTIDDLNLNCFDIKIILFGIIEQSSLALRLQFCENSFSGCFIGK